MCVVSRRRPSQISYALEDAKDLFLRQLQEVGMFMAKWLMIVSIDLSSACFSRLASAMGPPRITRLGKFASSINQLSFCIQINLSDRWKKLESFMRPCRSCHGANKIPLHLII